MLTVFFKVASIFAMAGVGYIACKKNVLPYAANTYLVSLLMTITLPSMIVSSSASQTLTEETARQAVEIMAGSIVFFIIAAIISLWIVKLLNYNPKEDWGVLTVIITATNTGFMGFPVTRAIFGEQLFFLMVLENIILNFYLYSLCVLQMNYGHGKGGSLKDALKPLCNMCTLALCVSLFILITRMQMPTVLFDFFDTLGSATVPVSMIVVGIQLANGDLRQIIKNHKLVFASLCNVILIPVLTFLAVHWLPITDESKLILIFAACFPCAVITVALSMKEGRNSALMAEGVALTTFFSMITLPVAAMILTQLYC